MPWRGGGLPLLSASWPRDAKRRLDVGGGAAKEKIISPKKAAASLRGSGRAQPESEEESSVWQLPRSGHRSHLNFTDIKTKGKHKLFILSPFGRCE